MTSAEVTSLVVLSEVLVAMNHNKTVESDDVIFTFPQTSRHPVPYTDTGEPRSDTRSNRPLPQVRYVFCFRGGRSVSSQHLNMVSSSVVPTPGGDLSKRPPFTETSTMDLERRYKSLRLHGESRIVTTVPW